MAAVGNPTVHRKLGGNFVADVLLWRKKKAATLMAVGSSALWILFEFLGYSPLVLIVNTILLLVFILFFWAKAASLLNRPLPPIPNLEISTEVVGKWAQKVVVLINRVLAIGREIGVEGNRKVFLKVNVTLWVVSYIGSLFSFFTLVYIGVVLSLTVPVLYERYEVQVNEKISMLQNLVVERFGSVLGRSGRQPTKEKKGQ